jgi:hypothetical protein
VTQIVHCPHELTYEKSNYLIGRKQWCSKWLNALEIEEHIIQTKNIPLTENRPSVYVEHTDNNSSHIVPDMNTKWLSVLSDKVAVRLLISIIEDHSKGRADFRARTRDFQQLFELNK